MRAALALLLLLAACGPRPAGDQAACEAQADADPAVREQRIKAAGSPQYLVDNQELIRRTRQDAVVACLRSRGLAPPGGVERPALR